MLSRKNNVLARKGSPLPSVRLLSVLAVIVMGSALPYPSHATSRSSGGWTQEVVLAASDGAAVDLFGISVAYSGDTALVGAPSAHVDGNTGQGAAYVFTRSGGAWSEQAKLTAADGAEFDAFGTSVALIGDTAVVGAQTATVNGNNNQGAAYLFTRVDGVWSEQAKLVAADGAAFNQFGSTVALAGDTVLVGAIGASGFQGAVYFFTHDGEGWQQTAKLTAPDGASGDGFGFSIDLDGDTALVGAWQAGVGGNAGQGAAYVFTRDEGVWSEPIKLTASDGGAGDTFGRAVALSDDTAVVGAATEVGGNANQGAAYVFVRDAGVWDEQAKLTAADGVEEDFFGVSVALSGDAALIGASFADVDSNADQGAAYVFIRDSGVWSEQAKLTAAAGEPGPFGNRFGSSVALAGDTALVGASEGNSSRGAAHVFVDLPDDFAVIRGTVRSLGYCGADVTPLAGAQVEIVGGQSTYVLETGENGTYQIFLPDEESPLDVTVTAPSHLPAEDGDIIFSGGDVVVRDFDLDLDAPCATAAPTSLSVELDPDQNTGETLTLGNADGAGELSWEIATAEPPAGVAGGTVDCDNTPGLLLHDDGTIEQGYSANPTTTSEVIFVDRFTPAGYPASFHTVCLAWTTFGPTTLDFELVVFTDDGPDGGPGTELGALAATAMDIPLDPVTTPTWVSVDISSLGIVLDSGSIFIGARWAPSSPNVFLTADESSGNPPGFAGGFRWSDDDEAWTPIQDAFFEYRSLFVRAAVSDPGCDDPSTVSWLSADPASGSTPAGDSSAVQVSFDSTGLHPGERRANLCIETNDPVRPLRVIPAALTVSIPPHFAVIEGTVEGLGYCAAEPGAVPEAEVVVESQAGTFTVVPDADGFYGTGVDPADGPVDMTASAPGHLPRTVTGIELAAGETVVQDLDLVLQEPCAEVTPQQLTVVLPEDTSETSDLNLSNVDGGAILEWTIETAEPNARVSRAASFLPSSPDLRAPGGVAPPRHSPTMPASALLARNANLSTIGARNLPHGTLAVGPGVDCEAEPGLVLHDDGTIENGYSDNPGVAQAMFVDRFTPGTYPAALHAVCVALLTPGPTGQTSLDFELVVFDDDGPGGGPGTELGALAVSAEDIPVIDPPIPPGLEPTWFRYDISSLDISIEVGSAFIGLRWPTSEPNVFLAADESPGNPVGFAGGFRWDNNDDAWIPIEEGPIFGFPNYRSLFVRAVTNDPGCDDPIAVPWLDVDPAAGSTPAGEDGNVQVTVDTTGLAPGDYAASLCVASNDPRRPMTAVSLALTVTDGGTAELTFDPSSLAFGGVEVGTTSPPQTTTLENTGDVDLTGIAFTPPGDGFAADTSACGAELPAGESCAVSVTFTPTAPGPATATLEATSEQGAADLLALTGNGVGGSKWSWQNPLPQGNPLQDIAFIDADNGTAVGTYGAIVRTTDGGATWVAQESGTTVQLNGVTSVDASRGTAVGDDGTILGTTDGGNTWVQRTSGTANDLHGVAFPDPDHGIAIGSGGTILTTADGGETWTPRASGTASELRDVSFSDLTNGTAVGTSGVILRTTDGGETWEPQASGTTNTLSAVSFTDSLTGTAVGSGGRILRTTDGGETWVPQNSGVTSTLHDVAFADADHGWVVGFPSLILHTSDGGTSWTQQPSGVINALLGVAAIDVDIATAVGPVGVILRTADGGVAWENQLPGPTDTLVGVSFTDPQTGTAVGNAGTILRTTDAGAHWVRQDSGTTTALREVFFTDADHGTAVGEDGVILRTTDGGESWQTQVSGTTSTLRGIYFTATETGVVVGFDGTILTTTDGGAEWVQRVSGTSQNLYAVSFADADHGLAVGDGATVLKTTDGGVTWSPLDTGSTTNVYPGVSYVDSQTATVVGLNMFGTDSRIFRTTDGGSTWIEQEAGTSNPLNGVFFVDANRGTAVGGGGTILSTTDGGETWVRDDSRTTNILYSAVFNGADHGTAVGFGGTILRCCGAAGELSVAPDPLDFGEVPVGETGGPLSLTLINTGTVEVTVSELSGPDAPFAPAGGTCDAPPFTLSPAASCTLDFTFAPSADGEATSSVTMTSDAPSSPHTATLQGIGVGDGAPELALEPQSLAFGDVPVGTPSAPQLLTLSNTGDAAASELMATIDPPGNGFSADLGACGDTLPAGESCPVEVTFTPVEVGPAAATLEIGSAEGATATAGLSGNGVGGEGFTPVDLAVDPPGLTLEANGLFEPGETVDVAPAWRNDSDLAASLVGTASNFTGPEGAAYSIDLDAADYGLIEPGDAASCLDTEVCYRLGLDDPAAHPAAHWDASFDEILDDTDDTTQTWALHIGASFDDVPSTSPFYPAIETLLHSGVTGGCAAGAEAAGLRPGRGPDLKPRTDGRDGARPLQAGGAAYCPGGANSRAQMPVFMLRALEGADYTPPACEGDEPFGDVPVDSTFCPWIQELANRGIVSGCGDGDYCPGNPVTRAQMAIFLLKTLEGAAYEPPECTERFTDVPCPSLFADWIEDLAARGITGGCSETEYCPADAVTRAQMAVFVTRTFGLTLYGP